MKKWAWYNEIDPYAAQWLRNLIAAGLIAPGEVDERDIRDVRPDDIRGFLQCHFFAGIGVWSYALRLADWSDDREVWTGSCPCQPFSAAGKGLGFADERHLWPAWQHLIRECGPDVVFGEQVASKDGLAWLDTVHTDMEGEGYAFGAVDTCSAGVGAPHIRQRLRFVADTYGGNARAEWQQRSGQQRQFAQDRGALLVAHTDIGASRQGGAVFARRDQRGDADQRRGLSSSSSPCALADGESLRRTGRPDDEDGRRGQLALGCDGAPSEFVDPPIAGSQGRVLGADGVCIADERGAVERTGEACELGDASGARTGRDAGTVSCAEGQRHREGFVDGDGSERVVATGPTNGFWRDADWIFCTDNKWRAVEPGTFPLAHGAPSRVGRLRAYGNAVDAEATRVFIESYIEARSMHTLDANDLF